MEVEANTLQRKRGARSTFQMRSLEVELGNAFCTAKALDLLPLSRIFDLRGEKRHACFMHVCPEERRVGHSELFVLARRKEGDYSGHYS